MIWVREDEERLAAQFMEKLGNLANHLDDERCSRCGQRRALTNAPALLRAAADKILEQVNTIAAYEEEWRRQQNSSE